MLKKLAGQTALYGVSSILGRVLNYLLTPLYTSVLFPEELGVVTHLYAAIAFFNVLYTFGFETAFFRFSTKTEGSHRIAYKNAFTFVAFVSCGLSLAMVLFSNPISQAWGYEGKGHLIRWCALILCIDGLVAIPFANLRLQNKAVAFATARLVNILLNIFFNIFFLILLPLVVKGELFPSLQPFFTSFYQPESKVEYIFLANLLANASYFIFIIPGLRGISLGWKISVLKPMFKYAYPILLMGLAGTVNEMFSREFLKEMLPKGFYPELSNLAVLGIFGACYKLSVFMSIAIQAFRYALEPFFFSKSKDADAPQTYARIMHYFSVVCFTLLVLVCVNIDVIAKIFLRDPVYHLALGIVPYLLIANLFLGVYYNLSVWYKLTDQTFWGTYISLFGVVVTLAANFLLIPVFGFMGSAYATLLCYVVMAVVSYALGQKKFPIPYQWKAFLLYIFCALFFVLFYDFAKPAGSWNQLWFGLGLSGIWLLFIIILEGIRFRKNKILKIDQV